MKARTRVPEIACWVFLLIAIFLMGLFRAAAAADDATCTSCTCNGDRNGDRVVTVDEVVAAVSNLLNGCEPLLWQPGCGPPFGGGTDDCSPDMVNVCTTERLGEPCDEAYVQCCPANSKCLSIHCNWPLICATHPPRYCPISRRDYKRDIQYLKPADVEGLRKQLLGFKLARYRYKGEGPSAPEHLGFIIEDIEPSPAVDAKGDAVNLYGYLSMAVATLQAQSNDIDALKREIHDLRQRLHQSSKAR